MGGGVPSLVSLREKVRSASMLGVDGRAMGLYIIFAAPSARYSRHMPEFASRENKSVRSMIDYRSDTKM